MLVHNAYPVLEYDDNRDAKLNPKILAKEAFKTDKLVITFFPEGHSAVKRGRRDYS
jgi:uridine phosphorylase